MEIVVHFVYVFIGSALLLIIRADPPNYKPILFVLLILGQSLRRLEEKRRRLKKLYLGQNVSVTIQLSGEERRLDKNAACLQPYSTSAWKKRHIPVWMEAEE